MIGFNLSTAQKPEIDLSPADRLFCEMVSAIVDYQSDPVKYPLYPLKQKCQDLYDRGYEDGREDEQGVSKKGGQ